MSSPRVRLRRLDEENLPDLLEAAVGDADPLEVMPPIPGPAGWTEARKQAFRDFHRSRSIGITEPREVTYVIAYDDRVVGAARIERTGAEAELGLWHGRSHRGHGIGRVVTAELLTLAREAGADRIVASTTSANVAARQLLAGIDAELTTDGGSIHATVDVADRA